MKSHTCILAVLVYLAPAVWGALAAIPIETGISYSIGDRQTDRFSRGMHKFRSSTDPFDLSYVNVDPFASMNAAEFFLQAAVFDSDQHFMGITFGEYQIPDMPLVEVRSDLVTTYTNWSFQFSWFLFHYQYQGHFAGRWNRKLQLEWDGGAGFGYLTNPRWKVQGYSRSNVQLLNYNINQSGDLGNILRLQAGLRRRIWDNVYVRAGGRVSYIYVGRWNGQINNADGTFYYAADGSLMPLSSFGLLAVESVTRFQNNPLLSSTLIKSRAHHSSGVLEMDFSLLYRF
ncbi:MAG: hypothetical protein KDK39_04120 [Leptospiraceae bacterium]|nr:hypothetical protein [Leptospiraceae bacterium]